MNADVINSNRMSGPVKMLIMAVFSAIAGLFALYAINPDLNGVEKQLASMGLLNSNLLYVVGAVVALAVLVPFVKGGQSQDGNDFAEGEEMVDTGPSRFSKFQEMLSERATAVGRIVWFTTILFACNAVAAVFMGYEWMSHHWFYAMLVAFSLEAVAIAIFHRKYHLDRSGQDRQYFAFMLGYTMIGSAAVSQIAAQFKYQVFGIEPMYLFFYVAGVAFVVWGVSHLLCGFKKRDFPTVTTGFVLVFAPFWVSVTFMGKFGWSELTCLIPVAVFWSAITIGMHLKKR